MKNEIRRSAHQVTRPPDGSTPSHNYNLRLMGFGDTISESSDGTPSPYLGGLIYRPALGSSRLVGDCGLVISSAQA